MSTIALFNSYGMRLIGHDGAYATLSLHLQGSPTSTGCITVRYLPRRVSEFPVFFVVSRYKPNIRSGYHTVMSRLRYNKISFHHNERGVLSHVIIQRNVTNIHDPTGMDVLRQYVSMFLCVFVSHSKQAANNNNGCVSASSQLLNLACFSILALYHGSGKTGRLVLLHSIP
jgi:hypothetical protein